MMHPAIVPRLNVGLSELWELLYNTVCPQCIVSLWELVTKKLEGILQNTAVR
jgi:hypothetical protein